MSQLQELLLQHSDTFATVLPPALQHGKAFIFDLGAGSEHITGLDFTDPQQLQQASQMMLKANDAVIGISRYAEERIIYSEHDRFLKDDGSHRCIHLGIDLTVDRGTPVQAPLSGIVHTFRDNTGAGNFGPTVILQHQLGNQQFYTLYGHLSHDCLSKLQQQQAIAAGEIFATVGDINENGGWPTHLHFQIIDDIDGVSDFPGVAGNDDQHDYLTLCPDPNLILQIAALQQ
jgi:murein DD-endopeptidase MepM/ murein hydrolase activator NlpD